MHGEQGARCNSPLQSTELTTRQPKEKTAAPAASSSAVPATPAQAPAATPAAPAPRSQPSAGAAAPGTPTPASRNPDAAAGGDSAGLAMGAQRSEAIANMEAMGFERAQIEAAMRAAFNNPDRAVEYLLNVSTWLQKHRLRLMNVGHPRNGATGAAATPGRPSCPGSRSRAD